VGGDELEVDQGVFGKLDHDRVVVSQDAHQQLDPFQFLGAQPDHRQLAHVSLFGQSAQIFRYANEEWVVSGFLDNAARILEVAQAASQASDDAQEISILIRPGGGLHVVTRAGWRLEALLAECGASTGYRVTRAGGTVRVEGKSQSDVCWLEKRPGRRAFAELLRDQPAYQVVGSAARMLLT
jgi:hypothetical protein